MNDMAILCMWACGAFLIDIAGFTFGVLVLGISIWVLIHFLNQ